MVGKKCNHSFPEPRLTSSHCIRPSAITLWITNCCANIYLSCFMRVFGLFFLLLLWIWYQNWYWSILTRLVQNTVEWTTSSKKKGKLSFYQSAGAAQTSCAGNMFMFTTFLSQSISSAVMKCWDLTLRLGSNYWYQSWWLLLPAQDQGMCSFGYEDDEFEYIIYNLSQICIYLDVMCLNEQLLRTWCKILTECTNLNKILILC